MTSEIKAPSPNARPATILHEKKTSVDKIKDLEAKEKIFYGEGRKLTPIECKSPPPRDITLEKKVFKASSRAIKND